MVYEFDYSFKDKVYKVRVTKKKVKAAYFRFKDKEFHVTCPYLYSKEKVINALNRFADGLLKRNIENSMKNESAIYLFGDKYDLDSSGGFTYNNYYFKNFDDFIKRCKKSILLTFESRVREYEKYMGVVSPYKVRIQNMSTRYGSNSRKTHTLNFQLKLIHYSWPIIDSVIVHELAHHFEFNHSEKFYNVVYKYFPKYDYYQKFLKKGEFHD